MSKEILPGFINQIQPPVFLAEIEPPPLIKNEPPKLDEDVDLVSNILPEDLIKSETVPETTFETKYIESVETQVFVKTENAPFVKIENITESEILNKAEDTGNKGLIEIQGNILYDGCMEYYCDICGYKTYKINHFKRHKLTHLKPEEIQYFYCYHCSHKAKHKADLKIHILRHFEKGNVPFHCYICNFVTQRRDLIITHIRTHTTFKLHEISCEKDTNIDQKLKLHCDKCTYTAYRPDHLRRHKIIHLKPEEIQYFYCYHCSHKFKRKDYLKVHLSIHFRDENVPFHCYICNFVTLKRDLITEHIRRHPKVQIKCEIKEES